MILGNLMCINVPLRDILASFLDSGSLWRCIVPLYVLWLGFLYILLIILLLLCTKTNTIILLNELHCELTVKLENSLKIFWLSLHCATDMNLPSETLYLKMDIRFVKLPFISRFKNISTSVLQVLSAPSHPCDSQQPDPEITSSPMSPFDLSPVDLMKRNKAKKV